MRKVLRSAAINGLALLGAWALLEIVKRLIQARASIAMDWNVPGVMQTGQSTSSNIQTVSELIGPKLAPTVEMLIEILVVAGVLAVVQMALFWCSSRPGSGRVLRTIRFIWLDLWASYDLDMVDQLFLADSTVTYFSSEREGLIVGIDAVRTHHEGFGFVPGGRSAEQDLWVEDVHTATFWPTAIDTGIWLFGDREAAPEEAQRGPFTFVYVQTGDTYRVAHMNFGTYLE